jgi:nitroreductase
MDLIEAIRTRKSIRLFKPDPVPKEILTEILETAVCSPSAVNCQPWEFTVLAGDVIENIKKANVEMIKSGVMPQMERPPVGKPTDSVYRRRQVELGIELFKLMGIERDDTEKRMQWAERGFRFFDAPAAIILSADRSLGEAAPLIDIGAVMQTICLVALNYGLGTCIENQGVSYPDVLRKFAGIPESKQIIIAIAIGYPDLDFPANKLRSTREPVDNVTTWCGFE